MNVATRKMSSPCGQISQRKSRRSRVRKPIVYTSNHLCRLASSAPHLPGLPALFFYYLTYLYYLIYGNYCQHGPHHSMKFILLVSIRFYPVWILCDAMCRQFVGGRQGNDQQLVSEKRRKDEVTQQKRADEANRLSHITLELDINKLHDRKFTNKMLIDQIELHRQFNSTLPLKSKLGTKALVLDTLKTAIDYYNSLRASNNLVLTTVPNLEAVSTLANDFDGYDSDSSTDL